MEQFRRADTFARVVEAKSFSAAARQLGVAKSVISKHIRELEQSLGVRLLNRSTRSLSLTEAGQIYYRHSLELLQRANLAMTELRQYQNQPTGTLRITSPIDFGTVVLAPVIEQLKSMYPKLNIDLQLDDQIVDMVEHGIDLAIRVGWLKDSSLVARKIGEAKMRVFASPNYLAHHGSPKTPIELAQHQWIALTLLQSPLKWLFTDRKGASHPVTIESSVKANSVSAVVALAKQGLGISAIADYVIADDLITGRLLPLLSQYQLPAVGVYAVYPHRQHVPAKVQVLLDLLQQHWTHLNSAPARR
ncbi:LysR family transcriptional regulator [Neiella marina]|uniref:LysR family transcriptional regulator n=1 Tax=Neiella marina TaxID=508461 RepID=A0A8J2U2H9_9GAMM|nr:LysR family transcriptional regulator [Neiella marina]GGA66796.1 LysR family transcriptional regulator [Neiella marina]